MLVKVGCVLVKVGGCVLVKVGGCVLVKVGGCALAKVGASICVWVAPTRRGREFDANVGAGSPESSFDTADVPIGCADLSDAGIDVRAS